MVQVGMDLLEDRTTNMPIGIARAGVMASKGLKDPFFSSVTLLAHFNGTNASTSFPDSSNSALTLTANGSAQLSTTSPKYGSAALTLSGSGDYVTIPAGTWCQLGSGAFTLEMWINKNAGFSQHKHIISLASDNPAGPASTESLILEIQQTTGYLVGGACVGSTYYNFADTVAISTGTWVHVALVSTGSTLYLFKGGSLVGSQAISGSVNYNAAWFCYIGRWTGSSVRDWDGKIDDIRLTKGVARYTSAFTPPTAEFPNS